MPLTTATCALGAALLIAQNELSITKIKVTDRGTHTAVYSVPVDTAPGECLSVAAQAEVSANWSRTAKLFIGHYLAIDAFPGDLSRPSAASVRRITPMAGTNLDRARHHHAINVSAIAEAPDNPGRYRVHLMLTAIGWGIPRYELLAVEPGYGFLQVLR